MPKLRPYQEIGAKFLASHRRAALYDSPRVGKTPQSLVATKLVKAKKVAIICPASLQINWRREAEIWNPNCKFFIVSYNFIQKEDQALTLALLIYDALILDECHNLKNWGAKQAYNLIKIIAPRCRRIWLLSGTPATRSAADYHTQLSLLLPGKIGTFGDFKSKYTYEREVGTGRYKRIIHEGFRNTKELNKIIRSVSLRRTLEEVEKELPPKVFSNLFVDVDHEEVPETDISEEKPPESILPYLRQLGLSKARCTLEYLQEFDRQLVIWCWFRDTKEFLLDNLKYAGVVSGAESSKKKQFYVDKFQAGKLKYLVCNIAAGGTGHTFNRAKNCIFIELCYSPALYEQAYSRIVSPTNKIHVINVIAPGSLDDRIIKKLRSKVSGMRECLR